MVLKPWLRLESLFVRALICDPFSAVLGHPGVEVADGWDGARFC